MNLKSAVKLGLLWFGAMRHRNRGSKVLYYHDVYKTVNYKALDADINMGTPLELFKKHIDVIKAEGYEIVPHITKPEGQIAIMFDDGFRGIWECRDYFYKNGISPTIFLPVEFIDRTDLGMLTLQEIKELQNLGFSFQSHTWSHRPLTSVPSDELHHELEDSRKKLAELLDENVTALCMPLGFFTPQLIDRIKQAGYSEIYSCLPGNVDDKPFGLITRNLAQYVSPKDLKLILRGGNESLKKRYLKLQCHN